MNETAKQRIHYQSGADKRHGEDNVRQGQTGPPGDTRFLFFIQWPRKDSLIRCRLTRSTKEREQGSPVHVWANAKVHSWKNSRKAEREMTKDESKRR